MRNHVLRARRETAASAREGTDQKFGALQPLKKSGTPAAKNRLRWICPILSVVFLVILTSTPCFSMDGLLRDRVLDDREARWQITAKKMSYNEKEGLYVAEGEVTITRNGQTLSSRRAIYNEKTGIVQVSGDVRLEANGDLVTGETGIFDLNSHNGQITKGSLFIRENHFYVRGTAMMRLGPNTYMVRGCRLSTCDGKVPDWSVTGSEVKVTIEGYGTVKNAAFRIRDFPVFYLPYAVFPVKTKRQTGLLPPRMGYSGRNGMDMEVPFFWAISEQRDATFYERYMSKRGFMQGLEYRYVAEEDSKGIFLFDILSDRIEKKDLSNPEEANLSPYERTNRSRYWLRSRTDQELPLGLRARLDTDFVSDQDYLKEFRGGLFGRQARADLAAASGRPLEEIFSPTRRSALRLSRDRDDYSLQGSASYHQRPEDPAHDETPQPFAALNFAALPRPVTALPLSVSFTGNHDYVWRETGVKGHRVGLAPSVSYPMWFGPYVEFEPTVSLIVETQWPDDPREEMDRQTRDVYQVDSRLSTVLERTFDFRWNEVRRLKHKVIPSLRYSFRGYDDEDKPRPWFEPVDEEGRANRIVLSIENLLDARKEDEKGGITYAQWGTFSISQGYDIHEAGRDEEPGRAKEPFEPLVGAFTFKPLSYLDLDAEAHWNHYEGSVCFADLALELTVDRAGGKRDTYEIDYQYLKGEDNTLGYSFNLNLVQGFSAGASQKRDFKRKQTLERNYWIEYESQCWGVRLIAEELDAVESIMVQFRLLGLGGV